jgi:hypothetical protein
VWLEYKKIVVEFQEGGIRSLSCSLIGGKVSKFWSKTI